MSATHNGDPQVQLSIDSTLWTTNFWQKHLLEGPVLSPDGSQLFFSDYFQGLIYTLDAKSLSIPPAVAHSFRRHKCNGLKFLPNGNLIACLTKNPVSTAKSSIVELNAGQVVERVSTSASGNFLMPNDIIVDEHSGIYFTDILAGHVFYHPPNASHARSCAELSSPNGIECERDAAGNVRTVFVAESGKSRVLRYDVVSQGKLTNRSELREFKKGRAVDGMALHESGHLLVAEEEDVHLLDSSGKAVDSETLTSKRAIPSNVCFLDSIRFVVTSYRSIWVPSRAELYLGSLKV